jgi:hypothetical protein
MGYSREKLLGALIRAFHEDEAGREFSPLGLNESMRERAISLAEIYLANNEDLDLKSAAHRVTYAVLHAGGG